MDASNTQSRYFLINLSLKIFIVGSICLLLYLGKSLFIPLSAGLLLSFILLPIIRVLERKGMSQSVAIALTIIVLLSLIGTVLFLYGNQIVSIIKEFESFQKKLFNTISQIVNFINEKFSLKNKLETPVLIKEAKEMMNSDNYDLLGSTLKKVLKSLGNIFLIIVFSILFLSYRKGLKKALQSFGKGTDEKKHLGQALGEASKVGRNYVLGVVLLIIILTAINTIGLLIIGVDYPLFFGFLPAALSIIPYFGSIMGASVVVVYAFFNYDSAVYPVSVLALFWASQILESNYLNPKIVGGNLKINILFVIIFLLIGQMVWGVSGLILAVPLMAIFKIFCQHFPALKPVAMLIGSELHDENVDRPNILIGSIRKLFRRKK
jgi:predicted PurR-regulated permease PerM